MRLAHAFAVENQLVTADCIEATEFPELAGHYRVFSVPRTIINDKASIEGSVPEGLFLDRVLKAIESDNETQEPPVET